MSPKIQKVISLYSVTVLGKCVFLECMALNIPFSISVYRFLVKEYSKPMAFAANYAAGRVNWQKPGI